MDQEGEAVAEHAGDQQGGQRALLDLAAHGTAPLAQGVPAGLEGILGVILDVVGDMPDRILGLAIEVLAPSLRLAEAALDGIAVRSDEVAHRTLHLAAEFPGGSRHAIDVDHLRLLH
jgi:hypothetical protein